MINLELPLLNFPENYHFRFKQINKRPLIFCTIRKQWLSLTPEEWVRQHVLHWLINNKKYPTTAIVSEHSLNLNGTKKRADIIIYKQQQPFLVVECKAHHVKVTEDTFEQATRYNMALNAKYIMLSNGFNHFYCLLDSEKKSFSFLEELPDFNKP